MRKWLFGILFGGLLLTSGLTVDTVTDAEAGRRWMNATVVKFNGTTADLLGSGLGTPAKMWEYKILITSSNVSNYSGAGTIDSVKITLYPSSSETDSINYDIFLEAGAGPEWMHWEIPISDIRVQTFNIGVDVFFFYKD